jgi:hypothetical protein
MSIQKGSRRRPGRQVKPKGKTLPTKKLLDPRRTPAIGRNDAASFMGLASGLKTDVFNWPESVASSTGNAEAIPPEAIPENRD